MFIFYIIIFSLSRQGLIQKMISSIKMNGEAQEDGANT